MDWARNRAAANPTVVKTLLGVVGFGLLVLAAFVQPWVPIEISAPEAGVLIAMPSPLANPNPTVNASSPKESQAVYVPIAPPSESDALPATPVVQTAEVSAIPVPPPEARIVPTYAEHIAPLLNRHCIACHQDEDEKLLLTDSNQVVAHASQIADATKSGRMPPWKPKPGFGHFRNERRLTDAEIALVQDWVKAGAPLGELHSIARSHEAPGQWVLGKPTVAYQLPEAFQVPASEDGLLWNFVIPTGVERDLYLTGAELRPGNKALVKRMTLSFDPTGTAREKDKESTHPGFPSETSAMPVPSIVLAEWSPGMLPSPLPKGAAYHIPKGADLVLTVDYVASPVSAPDPWQMGLHITRTPPEHRLGRIELAGEGEASYRVPTDTIVYSLLPEFDDTASKWFRETGSGMRVYALTPSGENLPLVHIEGWEGKWRERYDFREPIPLPKNSRIIVQTWLNGSSKPFLKPPAFRCELEVTTLDPANLEPLMRHNQAANGQP